MGDANGWTYRKDWFSRPELKEAFKAQYKRELAPPKTWQELYEVAKFFQGREIDGKQVYGEAFSPSAARRDHHGPEFGTLCLGRQL